jgi:membrane associated rhomboid family serine protease
VSVTDPLGGLMGSGEPARPSDPGAPEDAGQDPRLIRREPTATPTTVALLAVLAAFFMAQLLLSPHHDGTEPLLLYRMGSLHAPSIRDGDFFRLGSYAFLHVGVAHFLINGYALWILMRPLEVSLGGAVTLGIFASAALLGGAASATHAELSSQFWQQSAGASGGIFGLFGATGGLWFRLRHHLPQEMVRAAMRNLILNLLINAAIAFIAPVDSFAHAGGFIGGALLALAAPMRALPARPWHAPVRWLLISCAIALAAMEGAAIARAVNPKDRLLADGDLTARAPFWLPQIAPGEAVSVHGVSAHIYRDPEPAARLGPARPLGGRLWTDAAGPTGPTAEAASALASTSLEAPAGAGRVVVEVRCDTTLCVDDVRPLAEKLAASIQFAR